MLPVTLVYRKRHATRQGRTLFTLQVVDLLRSQRIDELILALPEPSSPELLNLVGRCRGQGINVSLVPQPYELYLSKPDLLDLGGLPLLRLRESLNLQYVPFTGSASGIWP